MATKKSLFVLVGSVLLCSLVGCTSNTPTSQPSSSGAVSSNSSTPTSTSTPTSVSFTFWHTFGQGNDAALLSSCTAFEKLIKEHDGVDLTINRSYQGGYADIQTKIEKSFATGLTPTMAIAYPDHVAGYLKDEPNPGDYVYNLEDYMNDATIGFNKQSYLGDTAGKDDFVEAFIDEGTHFTRQGTFTLPFMKSSEVMFYNVEAVTNAFKFFKPEITSANAIAQYMENITWDDFLALCKVAYDNKAQILSTMTVPAWYDDDANLMISKMYQNNIGYSSIDANGKGVIDYESGTNRTNAEAMVTRLKSAYDAGYLKTKGTEGTYGSDAFKHGLCLFTVGSSGGTGYNSPSGGAFSVGVCKVPVSNANPYFVSQGPTLTFLKNPSLSKAENDLRMKYAWMFAKFLTNGKQNVYQCVYGSQGYLPVRYSAYETDEYQTFLKEGELYAASANILINDISGHYLNTAVFPGSSNLRTQTGGILTQVFLGSKSVSDAFTGAINIAKTYM
jgi:multiple sugar transport system substrate-binding protein